MQIVGWVNNMAARMSEKILSRLLRQSFRFSFAQRQLHINISWLLRSVGVGCGAYCVGKAIGAGPFTVYASPQIQREAEEKVERLGTSHREERFNSFASLLVDDEPYMTPQDFLLSILNESPKIRASRRRLTIEEARKLVKNTPAVRKGKPKLFHNLQDQEPRSGFRIAFNMFDRDGNQKVDREEFRLFIHLMSVPHKMSASDKTDIDSGPPAVKSHPFPKLLESIIAKPKNTDEASEGQSEKNQIVDVPTTLMTHFFGSKGKDMLKFEDFQRFMDNFQTEVLELEFSEFSHGFNTITEESFAKILLRYTSLSESDHELYLERLRTRIPEGRGIPFQEFHNFCLFLNNLDDFALAVKIYSWADQPVNEEEFKRAVKAVTDKTMDDYVVHAVFCLFDVDGDGRLSDREFLSVMKDRLHRGFQQPRTTQEKHGFMQNFRQCMKETAARTA